jgi:NAD(P)-dependent dehydrogenase (short-subunit alcohol dehydrogenase family)
MGQASFTLVTGSSSGIGQEIACRLSKSRQIILHGRDQHRLEKTLSLCEPGNHVIWNFDLGDVSSIRVSLTNLINQLGQPIDEFVHSAGVPSVSAMRMNTALQMQNAMNVNAISAFEICSSLLRKNINQGALRRVVFISSIWSRFGSTGHTIYSASKGALDAGMRSMAVELAPIVRVNSIALGAIETPMAVSAFADDEIREHSQKNYPLGIGTTRDAADACEFLLSDSAKWITGQTLFVDGGRTAHMSNK